ncbi:DedA family protein [Actinospica sp. MGRD01-02]|uniref:DedA family protein n=1 Tax=Actinospica acidithermotolerans TaxID=2828514 RepID=A0A941E4N5_9ACTN|nr:DedA family protein [Actinospica acidithermotolerans]MBR7825096.1 DedA family protein [Actinospica acidithermotolerans]
MSLALINHLLQSYGYLAVFVFIAVESLGVPMPGETTLIAAALYAGSTHRLNIAVIAAVAAGAAVIGDNIGYWIGRRGGARLARRYGRHVGLTPRRLKVGRYLFDRHGGTVVFYSRFISGLRTYAAFIAGMVAMRRPGFVVANAAGALVWAPAIAFGAYGLGGAASGLGSALTFIGVGVSIALSVVVGLLVKRSMRSLEARADAAYPDEQAPAPVPVAELADTR